MRDHRQALLAMLQDHAPDGAAQQRCTTLVWEAERDGATPADVEKMLVTALSDGLNHGNWPWAESPARLIATATMQYRVADVSDIKAMLPAEIDKSAYDPDVHDLVFLVDTSGNDVIKYGRAVDTDRSMFQWFNVVVIPHLAELVPLGGWKPIEEDPDGR